MQTSIIWYNVKNTIFLDKLIDWFLFYQQVVNSQYYVLLYKLIIYNWYL